MLIFDTILGEKRCEYYKYSRVFQRRSVQKAACPRHFVYKMAIFNDTKLASQLLGLYQIFITTLSKISSVDPATDIQFSPSIKENLMNNAFLKY